MVTKTRLFYGNMAGFYILGIIALRLHTTGHRHTGSLFLLFSGTCLIALFGIALGVWPRRINPWMELLIYYAFSLTCFWAGGLFDL